MRTRRLHDSAGLRTYVVVFDSGDEVMRPLLEWAGAENLSAASFTGIGAFQSVTLGYFDLDRKDYHRIRIDEQVEVLSLAGNVAVTDGGPKVHAHVVVGKRDGTAHGGHLMDARVRPTLEVVFREAPGELRRRTDPATDLPLIDLRA